MGDVDAQAMPNALPAGQTVRIRRATRTRASSRTKAATWERANAVFKPLAKMAIRTAVRTVRSDAATWTPRRNLSHANRMHGIFGT
jgi:hypothetical protein